MDRISLFRPLITDEDIEEVSKVLKSGWIGLGPKTREFEEEFGLWISKGEFPPHCVALNSCTAALDLALKILDIGPGDEVIVPTMTFVSTAHAVAYNGARVIFADVEEDSLLIDFDDVANKISPRTKAIIPVHYSGRCVDIPRLREAASGIRIIEDCAHACGSSLDNTRAGLMGDLACFSFHAVKNLPSGDGGMLVSSNPDLVERARKLRWLGIDKSTWDRSGEDRSYWWNYQVGEIGSKCHMNDITAALALSQLDRLDDGNAIRSRVAEAYRAQIDHPSVIHPSANTESSKSSWHFYYVRVENRDEVSSRMAAEGIETGVHYKPIHLYDCYGHQPPLPVAEREWQKILTLPTHLHLTDEDLSRVSKTLTEVVDESVLLKS